MSKCVKCGKEHDRDVLCNKCIEKMGDRGIITKSELLEIMDAFKKHMEDARWVSTNSTAVYKGKK